MNITNRTLDVLTNFARINDGLVIKKGRVLSTLSPGQQLFARAELDVDLPADVAIADLRFLIQCLRNMSAPAMEFTPTGITIREAAKGAKPTRQTVPVASPDLVNQKEINTADLPPVELTFQIEACDFEDMAQTATKMKYERVEIVGKDGIVTLNVGGRRSSKFAGISGWTREVGKTNDSFRYSFFTENWAMIRPDAYTVELTSEGIAHFVGGMIEYWAVVEEDSYFTKGSA